VAASYWLRIVLAPTVFELKRILPPWFVDRVAKENGDFQTSEARMRLVVEFSRLNVEHGTGGPFGAAVFAMDSWRLIAGGVNRVIPLNSSIAHAEMLAIAGAQERLGSFDLSTQGLPKCELVTSCEPCAMCFGAMPWSGIRQLVCGARTEDAQRIGFDEGPKPQDWVAELERRGIAVQRDECREEAVAVLDAYLASGSLIYNPKSLSDLE